MPYTRRMSRGYRKRPYRKTRRGKSTRRRQSFKSRVKRVLMRNSETKYYDIATENRQLYHNLGGNGVNIPLSVTSLTPWFNPWLNIQNGPERGQRIGDKITPVGMSLKIYMANKQDRPNTMIRLIVAVLPKLIGTTITTEQFDPFQIANAGINGNNMLWPADKDAGVKFLYDKIHRFSSAPAWGGGIGQGSTREITKVVKLWIKRKNSRNIVFNTIDNTIINKPLAIYAIPYEQYSTLTTDNVASLAGVMRMYYKDV